MHVVVSGGLCLRLHFVVLTPSSHSQLPECYGSRGLFVTHL
jgi:hypothetical protein